jgi:hypothetical protein
MNRSGFLRGYIMVLMPNKSQLGSTALIKPDFKLDAEISANNGVLGPYFQQFVFDSLMVNIGGQ